MLAGFSFLNRHWPSLSQVEMPWQIEDSRQYQLQLINVIFVSNLTKGKKLNFGSCLVNVLSESQGLYLERLVFSSEMINRLYYSNFRSCNLPVKLLYQYFKLINLIVMHSDLEQELQLLKNKVRSKVSDTLNHHFLSLFRLYLQVVKIIRLPVITVAFLPSQPTECDYRC